MPSPRSLLAIALIGPCLLLSAGALAEGRASGKPKPAKPSPPASAANARRAPAPTPTPAPAPAPDSSDPIATATKASTKLRSFTGALESPKVDIFPVKAGFCYLVVLRLGVGATMERKSVQMDWPNAAGEQQPVSFGAEREAGTSALFKPDCAVVSASVGVWAGLQSFDGIKALGKGAFTLDVFERKGTKTELAAEAAADTRFHEESNRERAQARAKTCGECATPVGQRKVCLERRGVTMKDCDWLVATPSHLGGS